MSATDQWMPLYVGDYLADTMHLTQAEHGAYLLLLMHSWRTGPLPNDDARLAAIARGDAASWKRMGPTLRAFFDVTDDGLVQRRLERVRIEQGNKVEQRRAAGKASAAARKRQREVNEIPTTVDAPLAREGRELELEPEREEPPSPPSVVRSPRGSRLPADWQPSEADREFARSLSLDAGRVAEQFRDFWHAKAGKDAVKLDWPATWRGWCRRDAANLGKRPAFAAKPQSALGQWADLMQPPQRADLDGHAEEVFP